MKYIGIDIGDGESAITAVSEMGSLIPTVVPLGNVGSIRSVVGNLNDKPVVGDVVVLNASVTKRSARFKSRFLNDYASREDLRRFACGLYELFRKAEKDSKLKIALGCPAEWPPEAREQYAAIVASAGFSGVYTVSESRAAFLYAHYCNEFNLSPELLKRPTLVIDIGSSTLDYAYIVDGREREVGVFGEKHLGGGILDELILEQAVNASPDRHRIEQTLENSSSWKNYCELQARKLKEQYFLAEDKYTITPCSTVAPIYADFHNPMSLKISLSGATMEAVLDKPITELKGISFREALRESLMRAKEITRENPVELMIVTGGASRMKFFQEMCKDVFPDAMMALCEEPEYSIARGLGIAARTDDLLQQFRAKVTAYFESGAIEMEVEQQLSHLLPEYIPAIAKIICEKAVLKAVLEFQGESSQLEAYIQKTIGSTLADSLQTKEADALVNTWIGSCLSITQDKLNHLCDEYHIDRTDMALVKIHTEVNTPDIRVPLILRVAAGCNRNKRLRSLFSRLLRFDLMTHQMRRRFVIQMLNNNDDFAAELTKKLVHELQSQIDEQTRKVEIQIS